MNTSLVAADPVTHLKVVAVALAAATLVIAVSLFANGTALGKGAAAHRAASTVTVPASAGQAALR